MRIVTAGFYRSGSTWLFNAVRLLCREAHGEEQVYSCMDVDYRHADPRKVHVVKAHRYSDRLADGATVVTSWRGFDQSCDSMRWLAEHEPGSVDPALAEFYLLDFLRWQQHACHMTLYSAIVNHAEQEVWRLARALNLPVFGTAQLRIAAELAALPQPASGVDPVTQMHANHRRPG